MILRIRLKIYASCMMTSVNGSITRITDSLCGESTGHHWIPSATANNPELWWVFSYAAQYVNWTVELTVVWNVMALMCRHYNCSIDDCDMVVLLQMKRS